jgi:uncharacterized membrane protein
MMWDYNDSWMHGSTFGGWFMFLGMITIVVAVVFLIVFLVRQTTQPASGGASGGYGAYGPAQTATVPATQGPMPESPRDILKRRYASGEIEREEYLQKLADL